MKSSIRSMTFCRALLCSFIYLQSNLIIFGQTTDILNSMRAIHIGGNWGRNPSGIPQQPEEYYQFLRGLSINWAGISVALHVTDSKDSTVERTYSGVQIPTFNDSPLRDAIRGFKNHNIKVYLTLAFEMQEAEQSQFPVKRYQLGDPFAPNEDPSINGVNWPWDPGHPDHQKFINGFWKSYIKEAVYYAKIAEQEGIKMFSLGTETDRLFRSRSDGGRWPNHFKDQIKALVDSVKKYFTGLVTYDMHWNAVTDQGFYGVGSNNLWSDCGFDVVGVSAYFKLVAQQPNRVLGVDELEAGWNNIFTNSLIPLKNRNPNKPVVFLEYGYVDALGSPFYAMADEYQNKVMTDNNANGKDDGEEQQANIYEAFYKANEGNARLIQGTFLWGHDLSSNTDWNKSFGSMRNFAVRNKLASNVVRIYYTLFTPLPNVPSLVSPTNGAANIEVSTQVKWRKATEAVTYEIQISDKDDFSTNLQSYTGISDTSKTLSGLLNSKTYYWHVRSNNAAGASNWSQTFSFTTEAPVGVEDHETIPDFYLYQNYPNPFNPETVISYQLKTGCFVQLKIYNILGNEIITLVNRYMPPGTHQITFDTRNYPITNGVYFYNLQAGNFCATRKLVIIK